MERKEYAMNNPSSHPKMTLFSMLRLPTQKTRKESSGKEVLGFTACPSCKKDISRAQLVERQMVCPFCGHHLPISAQERLNLLADPGTLNLLDLPACPENPLNFPGYPEKLEENRQKTGLADAALFASLEIQSQPTVVAVLDSRFFMGSMGVQVGEIITSAVEYALAKRVPLVIFSASGGARMQEGILSLMQMAKTSAALARFAKEGGLYISYLTHPTTGGVSASFAGLGDITLAEPGALIGFAGPRVIEQTIRQKLPEGFQRAEFQEEHGFVDRIVPRGEMKSTLGFLLQIHQKGGMPA